MIGLPYKTNRWTALFNNPKHNEVMILKALFAAAKSRHYQTLRVMQLIALIFIGCLFAIECRKYFPRTLRLKKRMPL